IEAFTEETDFVPDGLFHDLNLIPRTRVHENDAVSLVPRIAHFASLDICDLHRFARFPRAFDDGARLQILDATARERLSLSRFDELVLDDSVGHTFDLNLEAFADVSRLHGVFVDAS